MLPTLLLLAATPWRIDSERATEPGFEVRATLRLDRATVAFLAEATTEADAGTPEWAVFVASPPAATRRVLTAAGPLTQVGDALFAEQTPEGVLVRRISSAGSVNDVTTLKALPAWVSCSELESTDCAVLLSDGVWLFGGPVGRPFAAVPGLVGVWLSPDGRHLAAHSSNQVWLFDVETGRTTVFAGADQVTAPNVEAALARLERDDAVAERMASGAVQTKVDGWRSNTVLSLAIESVSDEGDAASSFSYVDVDVRSLRRTPRKCSMVELDGEDPRPAWVTLPCQSAGWRQVATGAQLVTRCRGLPTPKRRGREEEEEDADDEVGVFQAPLALSLSPSALAIFGPQRALSYAWSAPATRGHSLPVRLTGASVVTFERTGVVVQPLTTPFSEVLDITPGFAADWALYETDQGPWFVRLSAGGGELAHRP